MSDNSAFDQQVEKCVNMLHKATTDNEKLAALLLVTKLIKAENCDHKSQKHIFDGIGFKFLNRLLRTVQVPEGCENHVFKSLALTIFSCFCGHDDIMSNPLMLNNVPTLGEILVSYLKVNKSESETDQRKSDIPEMLDSCYDCLTAVCRTSNGRKTLVENQTVSQLCTCYMEANYGNERALEVLQLLGSMSGPKIWKKNEKGLHHLLDFLCKKFSESKELEKFTFCDKLSSILTSVSTDFIPKNSHSWPQDLVKTLVELICCQLGQKQRESTLILVSVVAESLGIEFLIPPNTSDNRPFLLAVNLCSVEIGMLFPFSPIEQILEKVHLLCGYFSLVENTIKFLVSNEEGPPLDANQIIQIHSCLKETVKCVMIFLSDTAKADNSLKATDPLIQACVRLVGMWMREERESLEEEISQLLPVLLTFSEDLLSLVEEEKLTPDNVVVLTFLFEGLCQLGSDREGRELLLRYRAHIPLGQYLLQGLNQLHQTDENTQLCVEVMCDLLVQLIESDATMIASEPLYITVMHKLSHVLSNIVFESESVSLGAAVSLLGLNLLQLPLLAKELEEDKQQLFLKTVIIFLSRVHVLSTGSTKSNKLLISEDYLPYWKDISTYWLSAMHVLTACVSVHPKLIVTQLLQSGWIPRILKLLHLVQKTSISSEISSAYLDLLYAIAGAEETAKAILLEGEGVSVAKKFGYSKLQKILEQ